MTTAIQNYSGYTTAQIDEIDVSQYPCVTHTGQADTLSDRYRQVPTIDIINHLRERDFKVTNVVASRAGSSSGVTGMHLVRMRQEMSTLVGKDCVPDVILTNSHDGSSRCRITLGLLRLVCANGLIVGSHGSFNYELTHVGSIRDQVFDVIDDAAEKLPMISAVIGEWGKIPMDHSATREFARRALELRVGAGDHRLDAIDLDAVTRPRRAADAGNDLWRTFNRVQENLSRGGISYVVRLDDDRSKMVTMRGINAPHGVASFNRGLWDLAQEIALPS
jgi:hypothetical protein